MPRTVVRLSAGREQMDDTLQALCFMAGANSIFYGDQLLTTANPQVERDRALFERLGLVPVGAPSAKMPLDEAAPARSQARSVTA